MKQSSFASLIESVTNILIGFGLSCLAQAIFLPLLGVPIPWTANFAFAGIMTVISIARSFALRRMFEALHIRNPLSPGALAIVAERRRQMEIEGWTAEHDAKHEIGDLALAGACYAMPFAASSSSPPPMLWPWEAKWWKPDGRRRNLVKAGALILAELDRFDLNRRPKKAVRPAPLPPMRSPGVDNSMFDCLVPARPAALAHGKSHSEHAGGSA